MQHIESHIQEQVVTWLRYQYPRILFTGGFAGETMTIQRAARRKRMGYRAGTPDIIILECNATHMGLLIEMKAPKGVLSPAQRDFHNHAAANGYDVAVCHSLAEAQAAVNGYMGVE